MPAPLVKFSYVTKGDNFVGTAEVPTQNGTMKFGILVPLQDIRKEVRDYLAQSPAVSGDSGVVGNLSRVYDRVATERARRRLGTLIKAKMGGAIRPYEIAGPAGYARRIAQQAANKAAHGRAVVSGDDVGFSLKKVVKGAGKGIAKGAKGVAKGTVKVAKGVTKGGAAVVSNPLTSALLTAVPGGNTALAIINAAKDGRQGPKQAIADIASLAGKGDLRAKASADALEAAARAAKQPPPSSGAIVALAAGGTLILGLLLLKK